MDLSALFIILNCFHSMHVYQIVKMNTKRLKNKLKIERSFFKFH